MTQIHLTLKTEFLKDLFIDDKGEANRKLVEKVIDTLLNAEVERLNGKIKRRESVIRIFPNVSSILKLMGAILMDENEKWSQRKYMELKGLTEDISLKAAAPMGRMEMLPLLLYKLLILMLKEFIPTFLTQLEYIQKAADKRQNIQEKIKAIDKEMQKLSTTMEQLHTVKKYRACYKEYKANPSDKAFFEEYKAQITLYENALSLLKQSYSKLPNSKDILDKLDNLQEKKNTLMQEYSSSKSEITELYQIKKNYEKYMGKEMEK